MLSDSNTNKAIDDHQKSEGMSEQRKCEILFRIAAINKMANFECEALRMAIHL